MRVAALLLAVAFGVFQAQCHQQSIEIHSSGSLKPYETPHDSLERPRLLRHEDNIPALVQDDSEHQGDAQGSGVGRPFVMKFSALWGGKQYLRMSFGEGTGTQLVGGVVSGDSADMPMQWYRQKDLWIQIKGKDACGASSEYNCCLQSWGGLDTPVLATQCSNCYYGSCDWCRLNDCEGAVVYVAKGNMDTCPSCEDAKSSILNHGDTLCLSGNVETQDARLGECTTGINYAGIAKNTTARIEELFS